MNKKSEIRKKIEEILNDKVGIEFIDMEEDDTRLDADLGLDSLDRIEVVIELEKAFNIAIPDEKLEDYDLTIGQLEGEIANIM